MMTQFNDAYMHLAPNEWNNPTWSAGHTRQVSRNFQENPQKHESLSYKFKLNFQIFHIFLLQLWQHWYVGSLKTYPTPYFIYKILMTYSTRGHKMNHVISGRGRVKNVNTEYLIQSNMVWKHLFIFLDLYVLCYIEVVYVTLCYFILPEWCYKFYWNSL